MPDQTQQQEEQEIFQAVPVSADALSITLKAEIDSQIATAKAFPRDLKKFLRDSEEMATLTLGIAESCGYSVKRRQFNQETGQYEEKFITGPSVRLAEILLSNYGNLRAAARIVGNDGRFITAQGMFHDLEKNTMVNMEVKRKITTKQGRTFSDDMQVVTGNAASAIAFRNTVFKVIPAAVVQDIYDKAMTYSKGTEADLPMRRQRAIKFFKDLGVSDKKLLETLEIESFEQIDLEMLQILSGMKTSYATKEFTLEELFPEPEKPQVTEPSEKSKAATEETVKLMDEAMNKNKNKPGKGKEPKDPKGAKQPTLIPDPAE